MPATSRARAIMAKSMGEKGIVISLDLPVCSVGMANRQSSMTVDSRVDGGLYYPLDLCSSRSSEVARGR